MKTTIHIKVKKGKAMKRKNLNNIGGLKELIYDNFAILVLLLLVISLLIPIALKVADMGTTMSDYKDDILQQIQ